jgi:ABC-2 type transport system permease protein
MVREKETGTAEQLMLTPLRRSEVVAAKMLPPFTVGMLSLVPSLGVLAWFDVPFRGSIALFVLASALALAACLAIGILISTFARTLQQPLRVLSLASPTPLHGDCAGRDTEGRWLGALWPQFAALAAIGLVLMLVGLGRLRRHLYA